MTNLFHVPKEDGVVSGPATLAAGATGCLQVNMNQILQQLFAKEQQRIESHKVLIRCDQLPYVFINASKIAQVCQSVLQMILEHPPAKGKLFLYIKCGVMSDNETIDLTLPRGAQKFEVLFNSNSQHLPGWDNHYQSTLKDCNTILQQYGGTFHYRKNSENSYLFQMILPGKLIEHATG